MMATLFNMNLNACFAPKESELLHMLVQGERDV